MKDGLELLERVGGSLHGNGQESSALTLILAIYSDSSKSRNHYRQLSSSLKRRLNDPKFRKICRYFRDSVHISQCVIRIST
jgi:protoheme ferro-lyase